jgi:hypothetical protein
MLPEHKDILMPVCQINFERTLWCEDSRLLDSKIRQHWSKSAYVALHLGQMQSNAP